MINRRKFLASTLATIGATATGLPPAAPKRLMTKAECLDLITPRVEYSAVVDRLIASLRERFAEELYLPQPTGGRRNRLHALAGED